MERFPVCLTDRGPVVLELHYAIWLIRPALLCYKYHGVGLPLAVTLLAIALIYSVLAMVAARRYLRTRPPTFGEGEPVSILKPLAGLDPDLESNLRTFFEQDYTDFEILFAVRRRDDPAVEVVEKLRSEYRMGVLAADCHGRTALSERQGL